MAITGDSLQPGRTQQEQVISTATFEQATGESLESTLNIDRWRSGDDLAGLSSRLQREVEEARQLEGRTQRTIREEIFPRLTSWQFAPEAVAGIYQATENDIQRALRGVLFAGDVEAADGTSIVIDMLPITIAQVAVCTTSYRGSQREWGHRIFRRDFRGRSEDRIDEMISLLEARRNRTGYNQSSSRDVLSDLFRRALMTYGERAILARKCTAKWRMGHGNPLAYELLTGSGLASLIPPSVEILRELLLDHKRFIFVPSSTSDRLHATIGSALRPLEYAVISTMEPHMRKIIDGGHYGEATFSEPRKVLEQFKTDAERQIVVGAYRVSRLGPAHVFYAHRDYVHHAAIIAMADGALHEHRGFPMLIDLADKYCSTMFHGDTLATATHLAFADAGSTLDYTTERMTR